MAQANADPLQTVWDALERADCHPAGPPHQFHARCPAHDGDSPDSLSVGIGADGRALMFCHVGCEAHAVVRALDLKWADLFPDGHKHARRSSRHGTSRRTIDMVLDAFRRFEIDYRSTKDPHMWVAATCPVCKAGEKWPLWIQEERNRVRLCCFNGCEQHVVFAKLAEYEEQLAA